MAIADNLKEARQKIYDACKKSGRNISDVKIVAVTKMRSVNEINELVALGISELGENRVQELIEKYDKIQGDVRWHLIGSLQKNKVKYIADKVVMIHSVESVSLAAEIDRQCAKIGRVMDILVQVNVSGEQSKSGISPDEAFEFIESIRDFGHIRIKGLMTMAPLMATPEEIHGYFAALKKLGEDISARGYSGVDMEYLSMGMSNDYPIAVCEGATHVRIGSALFR